MLPDKPLFLRVVMVDTVIFFGHFRAVHIGRGRDCRAAHAPADDLRFKMIDRYIKIPPFVLLFLVLPQEIANMPAAYLR